MRTTVIPAVKGTSYYVPTIFAGMVLAVQALRLPGVATFSESAEAWLTAMIARFPWMTSGFAAFKADGVLLFAALAIVLLVAGRVKKSRKKRDFAIQHHEPGHSVSESPRAFAVVRTLVTLAIKSLLATLVGLLLFASYPVVTRLYGWTCAALVTGMDRAGPRLAPIATHTASKVVLSLLAIHIASWLYALFVSRKHPPIQVRFHIDGYMSPTRRFHPIALMARKSPLVLYAQSDRTRGLHGASVPVARITARPFPGGNETEHYVLVRSDLEPQKVRRHLSPADIDVVKEYLRGASGHEPEQAKLAPRALPQLAHESNIYREAYSGRLAAEGHKLTPADVGRIVRELSEQTVEDVLTASTHDVHTKLGAQDRFSHGGRFFASVFDGNPLTPTVMLKENVGQTIACSRDPKQGYGPAFVRRGKLLMVLQHRRFQSGSTDSEPADDWEDDVGDDDDHGDESSTPVNIIKEDRKAWNQVLSSGFGEAYVMRMGDRQFIYDGWWVGSGEALLAWIPGLRGKRLAPRRIGYVTDEKNKIVAKIADIGWKVPTKLLGNYDRVVDVYDTRLAHDKNFGLTLCLLSQFMTHQNLYRENRLQQTLPTGGPPAGADDDVAL